MSERNRIRVIEVVEAAAGGVLRHVRQIIEHIDGAEFDVTVAVSPLRMRDPERELRRLEGAGARIEIVPMVRRPAPVSDLLAFRRLVQMMKRGRYDVVHAHSSKAGFLGRLAARRAGVRRVFYTPHAFAFQCGGWCGMLYHRLERIAAGFGGTIVAVSEGERELAVETAIVPPERACVIRNAVADSGLPSEAARLRARESLRLPAEATVVGTVGRLARQKAPGVLLEAAALLRDRNKVRFLVAGDGPLARRLARLADESGVADRVTFAGHRNDVADLYAATDIYVQPSLWEGSPYAVLDAMVRGLPVVASDIPGHRDMVMDGSTGLLVPAGDPPALARAIRSLLDDEEDGRRLGRAGRELVLREHSVPEFVGSIEALYRSG